jgi:rare lipoprotein A (peptidoglycan hydrolase)
MQLLSRALVVGALLAGAGAPASSAAGYAAPRQDDGMILSFDHPCYRSYTLWEVRRAARIAYRHRKVPTGSVAALRRFARCARPPSTPRAAGRLWRFIRAAWKARYAPPMSTAIASWYVAAGGPIACGGNSYALGVANKTLPCGTRLEVCYTSCVQAVVFDRGPYIEGRDLDLSGAVKNAIGFPDGVATIRYRVLN